MSVHCAVNRKELNVSNTFEDILNASVVYVFTGRKIIEKNVLQFARVDSKTIFTRVADIGIVIFEDGNPRVKKGDTYVSLCKSAFGSDVLQALKDEIGKLRQNITDYKQAIHNERQKITVSEGVIANCLKQVEILEGKVERKKNEIDNEYGTLSQV